MKKTPIKDRRHGTSHDFSDPQMPLAELNKLVFNTMMLSFMMGTKSAESPIGEMPYENELFKKIGEVNSLYENVRQRYFQQKKEQVTASIEDRPSKRSKLKKGKTKRKRRRRQ